MTWLPAPRGVDAVDAGISMLPPTYLTCLEVAEHADPDAVLARRAGRVVEMFTPRSRATARATLSIPPAAVAGRGKRRR